MAIANSYLNKFADFEEYLYSRRYSAVAFAHPGLQKWTSELALINELGAERVAPRLDVAGWSVSRVALAVSRNYFTKIEDRSLAVGDSSYVQQAYVALLRPEDLGREGEPVAVILSPYVRLLNRLLTRAGSVLGAPKLTYLCPNMNSVFEAFEKSSFPGMGATRISVRDKKEPAVELVSLTGRNPLKSNLRAELRKVGPGYSVRVEVQTKNGPVSVHLDCFGNYWWYHRAEDNISAPLALVELLLGGVKYMSTTDRPTYRVTMSNDAD